MIPKKSGGKIIGAHMTRAEEKAMNMEIQRQYAKYNEDNSSEVDAIILWILHEEFGFGEKRLKEFHTAFFREIRALSERYEFGDEDRDTRIFVCRKKLLEYGIDLAAWDKEGRKAWGLD